MKVIMTPRITSTLCLFAVFLAVSCDAFPSLSLSSSASMQHRQSSSTTKIAAVEKADVAACFGRLGDRAYVLPPSNVEGTAASGYEFGVLEAGRPKWLCTYEDRSGQTQGGGKELDHIPNWCNVLFDDATILTNKDALKTALSSERAKFQMPLSAPSGTRTQATEDITNDDAIDALWMLLGGTDGELKKSEASTALQSAALENGSDTGDHLTYACFERALLAAAATFA